MQGHGIARCSPSFCCDQMRFLSWGLTEAQFWDRSIMQQPDTNYDVSRDGETIDLASQQLNTYLQRYAVPEDVCRDTLNPGQTDVLSAA